LPLIGGWLVAQDGDWTSSSSSTSWRRRPINTLPAVQRALEHDSQRRYSYIAERRHLPSPPPPPPGPRRLPRPPPSPASDDGPAYRTERPAPSRGGGGGGGSKARWSEYRREYELANGHLPAIQLSHHAISSRPHGNSFFITSSTRAYSKEFFGVHNFKSSCMM